MNDEGLAPANFSAPAVRLHGKVDDEMYKTFRKAFDAAIDAERRLVVIELSTLGGDPEVARMMGEDVRLATAQMPSCRIAFLGKAVVYSAGVTFMSFFARRNRFLTRATRLLIHERKMNKDLKVAGPLTTCVAGVEAVLHELQCSIAIQNEGFASLVEGSTVTLEEVVRRAPANWYIEAEEARELGLIEEVL